MSEKEKPVVWLHGEVKSPPFSMQARMEAGFYLRALQKGMKLSLPQSRSMPSIGSRCQELRIIDRDATWRIIYRIDRDAIIILEVFAKKTRQTPRKVVEVCRQRITGYDSSAGE